MVRHLWESAVADDPLEVCDLQHDLRCSGAQPPPPRERPSPAAPEFLDPCIFIFIFACFFVSRREWRDFFYWVCDDLGIGKGCTRTINALVSHCRRSWLPITFCSDLEVVPKSVWGQHTSIRSKHNHRFTQTGHKKCGPNSFCMGSRELNDFPPLRVLRHLPGPDFFFPGRTTPPS